MKLDRFVVPLLLICSVYCLGYFRTWSLGAQLMTIPMISKVLLRLTLRDGVNWRPLKGQAYLWVYGIPVTHP